MSTRTPAPAGTTGRLRADLAATDVVVRHSGRTLVDVPRLHLEPHRPLTVVGESGSGKSLLAHALMGTLAPELEVTGAMRVGEASFDLADRRSRRRLWGRELALLPQEPVLALDPTMRVRHQVAEGAAGWPADRRGALRGADERLDGLGLAHAASAYPHTLSGGMAQRVAYAAATIGGAHVLVVDEPSKGLDPAAVDRLAALLLAHAAAGGLLLTITHDLRLARALGGDAWVMRDAAVVEAGPVEEVLERPSTDYARALVDADPARWSRRWPTAHPAGTGQDEAGVERGDEPVVEGRDLRKAYGDQCLFEGLDVTIRAGERWALTGPSGAGKTTLGDVLLGLTPVDGGRLRRADRAAGRLQKLYQDPALSFPRRVLIGLSVDDTARRHGVDPARVATLVEQVGLSPDLLGRRPDQVSGGELQRVAVVRAMLTRPVLLLADEATSRLDLLTQQVTVEALMGQVVEDGCGLLVVTHDESLAAALTEHRITLGDDPRR